MQIERKINLSVTDFKQFRQGGYLYVDKSGFIEHFLEEGSSVLLFCRPRRMGKSMNLTMLKYFFDLKEDSTDLFRGLSIEQSPLYGERNKYPVIHLNFREMHYDDYVAAFADAVSRELERYLEPEQLTKNVRLALSEPYPLVKNLLKNACQNLYKVYGVTPYIFIDEYDKLIMDNIHRPEFENIRNFVKSVMSNALKDNPYLGKAAITGVNRIAQESMFSDLNNIVICDVFEKSVFDTDFGFTEEEVETILKQVSGQERMEDLRTWYNNYRIGNKTVYFSYSVLSAIAKSKLGSFWGHSGVMDAIRTHLTPERVELITELINGFPEAGQELYLKDRLSVEDMKEYQKDGDFYSLLVQTGYLTYAPVSEGVAFPMEVQRIFMPNQELKYVWQEFIFQDVYQGKPQDFWKALRDIKNVKSLGIGLTDALNNRLSYYDFESAEPEKTYHVYVAGMMSALGYKWISNRESGLGRYDLAAGLPDYNLIFEFKIAKELDDMEKSACDAIAQIKEKHYSYGLNTAVPVFLIGVGFHGKMCKVVAEEN